MRAFDLSFGPNGPIAGELAAGDLSIRYDATREEVRAHTGELLGDDVFEILDGLLDGDPETVWVGWFGYAARPDLPARPAVGVPDAVWMRTRLPSPGRVLESVRPDALKHSTEPMPGWYADAFDRVQEHLRVGDSYEVNLTHRHVVESAVDPRTAYRRLQGIAPEAPYAGLIEHEGTVLVSASPECFARVDRDRVIETRPIKGTTPRDADPVMDRAQAGLLATGERFRAENLIITDLCRNDLSIQCEPGTVEVPALMTVEQHGSVHQLVTTIRGRLREDATTLGAVRAMFPPGSMTGAPKRRTMEIIEEVEASPRGIYSGAYGWIAGDGRCELAVVIRSLVRDADGHWQVGTGGGVTVHTDAAAEWAESEWKVRRLLAALDSRSR